MDGREALAVCRLFSVLCAVVQCIRSPVLRAGYQPKMTIVRV